MWQVWLVISGIFFILEMVTVGFLVFWFGIGALLAMVCSFFTNNLVIQTTVFLLSSTALLFLTKPLVKKLTKKDKVQTNAYSIIGKTGIVIRQIDAKKGIGQVKIDSETWTAKAESDDVIPVGTEVEVTKISGVKVIVKPVLVTVTK